MGGGGGGGEESYQGKVPGSNPYTQSVNHCKFSGLIFMPAALHSRGPVNHRNTISQWSTFSGFIQPSQSPPARVMSNPPCTSSHTSTHDITTLVTDWSVMMS